MKRFPLLFCALLAACASDDPTTGAGLPVLGNPGGMGGVAGADGGSPGAPAGGSSGSVGGTTGSVAGGIQGGVGANPGGGGTCSTQTVQTGRVAPDILIVLDRSGSMKRNGVNRWDPSVAGIKTITSRLEDRVRFGLMTFPGLDTSAGGMTGGGNVDINKCFMMSDLNAITQCIASIGAMIPGAADSSCAPGQLVVPIQPKSAMMISAALSGIMPNGATPTAGALQNAHKQLMSVVSGPDMVTGAKYVLLVTDGAPNCSGNGNNSQDPVAVQASVQEIQAMTKDGIKTYVLGYDTQNDAALKAALDQMAQAGGTGDKSHRAIGDEQGLVMAFEQITSGLISCDFTLAQPVSDASYVRVLLDGKQVDVNNPNGWVLATGGKQVTLQGSSCELVKQDGHTISVSIECDRVPPLQ